MKRRGKVFLVIVLVMAMIWTSMGTSNGLAVLARSVATTQSAEEEPQENSTNQKDTETEKTDWINNSTDEEKNQQSVMQDTAAEQNTVAAETPEPEVKQIDIANNITDVDMTVVINGEQVKVSEMSADTKIPAGASVDMTIGYSNVDGISKGSTLYYQLPKQIKVNKAQNGTLTEGDEENKVQIGSFTVSETGRVEISFSSDYIEKCGGMILSGQFEVSGSFSEDCGKNGTETILFGQQQVTLNFQTKEESSEATTLPEGTGDTTPGGGDNPEAPKDDSEGTPSDKQDPPEAEKKFGNLTIEKKVVGNNIPSEEYQIEVQAAEDNTDKDLTKVVVKDTATDKEIARTIESLSFTLKAGQKVEVQNLPVGKYSIKEKTPKDAEYTASYSATDGTVTVADGKTEKITITNTYKTELYVVNRDTASDIVLSGSELAIYKASDIDEKGNIKDEADPVKTWTSGSEKTDVTGSVKAGESYVLVEKSVSEDYEKAQAFPFTVDEKGEVSVSENNADYYDDATHTITLDNKKKSGTLSVKKVIEDGEDNDAFDFTVTFADFNNNRGGNVTVTRAGKDTTETVGTDGKLEIKGLTNNEIVKISGIPYDTTYTVTETQKEGYLETENSGLTGVIGDNSAAGDKAADTDTQTRVVNAEASITNTRLNGFTIKNLVKSSVPESIAENPVFKFKVTLTKNEKPYTGEVSLKYSEKSESETLSQKDSKEPGVYEDIELDNMQSVTFSNLPSGVKYTVEEIAQDNYESSVEVKNSDSAESTADETTDKSTGIIAEGIISKVSATIEFTNVRKVGSVSFTNIVKGTTEDKEKSQKYDYYIEVGNKPLDKVTGQVEDLKQEDTAKQSNADEQADSESPAGAKETVTISAGTLSLSDQQTIVIENLPAGTSYTIRKVKEENQNQKYVTSVDDSTGSAEKEGTIEAGKTVTTQFTNQVLHLNVEAQFAKSETEEAPAEAPEATFTLYNKDDVDDNGKVKDGVKVAKDRTFSTKTETSHDFQDVIEPGKSYVLVEKEAPAGHTHAENVLFEVSNAGITTARTDENSKAMKLDDTNNYTYQINHDLITVSIKKTDTSGNGLAEAKLLLKQGKDKLFNWTSGAEQKQFIGKLSVGEYTLSEVIAPSGYEVAPDISFKINQDGTVSVNGEPVKDNVIQMKDEAVSGEETGKIVVNNLITYGGSSQAVVDKTFYAALFSDADCEKRISDVRELKCKGTWSAYTVFENLKDGIYYVAQTDEDGNKLDSPEGRNVTGNGANCRVTSGQVVGAVITNELTEPGDDFINTRYDLPVTKDVTINGNPISDKFNGTFYVSVFTDPYYTNRAIDTYITELKVENGQRASATFNNLSNGTYYAAETDEDGNPVEGSNFDFDVTYDGDTKVSFPSEDNTDSSPSIHIVNDMKQSHADYQRYLTDNTGGDNNTPGTGDNDPSNTDGDAPSDTDNDPSDIDDDSSDDDNTDAGDDAEGTESNANKKSTGTTAKKKTTKSSSDTTKKSKSAKTGDTSPIVLYVFVAVVALAVSVTVYFRKRRETK